MYSRLRFFATVCEMAATDNTLDEVLSLIPMAVDMEPLEQVADTLQLDVTEIDAEDRRGLIRIISNLLNSVAFDAADDRTLKIQTCCDILKRHLGLGARSKPKQEKEDNMPDLTASEESSEEETVSDTRQKVRKNEKRRGDSSGSVSALISGVRLKDFKFDGQVGYPGEKGKLDFTGVMHNINMAQKRKFPPEEICYAAIRAIVPGHPTRTYLEGEEDLSIDKIIAAFRSHFLQEDVTDLYNRMTHASQGTGARDTAYTFIASMFGLRNEINSLCRNKHITGTKYAPRLVQSEMQKAIYSGLRDQCIRQDLKMLLRQDNLPDDVLLAGVTDAMSSKRAHDERMNEQEVKQGKKGKVSLNVITVSDEDEEDGHSKSGGKRSLPRRAKSKVAAAAQPVVDDAQSDVYMAQLASVIGTEIRGAVEPLQAQINDLNQRIPFQQSKNQWNPNAPPFQKSAASGGGGATKSGGRNSGGPANSSASAAPAPSGLPSEEWFTQLFQHVFANRAANLDSSGGGSSGNVHNGVFLSSKCKLCRDAGALACNHCRICHGVDHRNANCPKRGDPSWVPLN